jgi:hypothetical protein
MCMANVSSRTRFASLQKVFAEGHSPLMECMAQLSVLYEDLRIESYALTADSHEVKRLDYLDSRYRIHYFLRRSIATLFEFRGSLIRLSRTEEYKVARAAAFHPDATTANRSRREMFKEVSAALEFFQRHHQTLKNLRNAVGGHFSDAAAASATANLDPLAIGKLEVTMDAAQRGGGPKLHYAGEIAATAFTRALPSDEPRDERIEHAIKMIRDGYERATRSMHALIVWWLWERFV